LWVAFNGLIRSEALADSALRQQVPAQPDARTPLAGATSATAGPHLNRLLLEDAYPGEIAPQRIYFDEKRVGYLFAFCGLVSALVQGGIIGRLVKRFGEPRLTRQIWSRGWGVFFP
jgi:hypothetical protein